MHILLTRPLEDSIDLILKFKNLGHNVSHLPLIKISKVKYKEADFKLFKGVIFTSANAIKNLNLNSIDKNISCFCVGPSTEETAKKNGFQNTFRAEGNINNLKEIIIQNFDSKGGKLLYVRGEVVSYDLDKDLNSLGYKTEILINYKTLPIKEIDDKFLDEFKSKIPDIVYIYSENSAHNFLKLIQKYGLLDEWMNTNLMCIGEKSSRVLNNIKWKKIFLFNPGEEEFLLYKV